MSARAALAALIDLIAPRDCPACGLPAPRGLCAQCRGLLEAPAVRALAGAPVLAAASYRPPLDAAIRRYKYQARPDLAAALATLLPRALLETVSRDPLTTFVPVPLHRSRLAERGYDQAALLASAFARASGRRSSARALRRVRATAQQARLDESSRRQNVVGAFEPDPRARLAGRPVVLVDDVITTGATAGECVRVLRAAGANVVAIVCVATAVERSR